MEPRIETLAKKKLVGMSLEMTFAQNRTRELWAKFMARRGEVKDRVNRGFISMQLFDPSLETPFVADAPFVKWAAVEVTSHGAVPEGMGAHTMKGGTYAVFIPDDPKAEEEIWIPIKRLSPAAGSRAEPEPHHHSTRSPFPPWLAFTSTATCLPAGTVTNWVRWVRARPRTSASTQMDSVTESAPGCGRSTMARKAGTPRGRSRRRLPPGYSKLRMAPSGAATLMIAASRYSA